MNNNVFYTITMVTKTDRPLYLMIENNNHSWTFDYNEAIWFDNEYEATEYAKKWFKVFKAWKIKKVYTNLL